RTLHRSRRPGTQKRRPAGLPMAPTLSHQGCSTADQGPGLGPSCLQSSRGGTGIAHHGNSRANVNNVLARNTYLRQVLLTLTEGAELADHDSPPEATLQVVEGSVRLATATGSCELSTGDLITVPPERHSVAAVTDAAFMLTIRTEVTGG